MEKGASNEFHKNARTRFKSQLAKPSGSRIAAYSQSGATPEQLAKWAILASPKRTGYTRAFGAAHFRKGEFDKAIEQFENSRKKWSWRASDLFFLAMAKHQLGKTDEAQKYLADGKEWLTKITSEQWIKVGWWEEVESEFLMKEAEAWIQGGDQKP